jgi:hypothetical protein
VLNTGVSGEYDNNNSSRARVGQQSGISGGSTQVIVAGDTTLNAGYIRGDSGVLSTESVAITDLAQHTESSRTEAGATLTRHSGDSPHYRSGEKSSASKITGNVSVAQVSGILTQPSVQTALLLTKELRNAAAEYGGIDNVPVTQLRVALTAAGVDVPEQASTEAIHSMLREAISNGQQTVTSQFGAANVAPAVTETVLGALGFGR